MTPKRIEVTEEMVERAADFGVFATDITPPMRRYFARSLLTAALNPPTPEEIPVSEGMMQAGLRAFYREVPSQAPWTNPRRLEEITRAYRAMERVRREEAQERWQLAPCCDAWRSKPCALAGACCMNSRRTDKR